MIIFFDLWFNVRNTLKGSYMRNNGLKILLVICIILGMVSLSGIYIYQLIYANKITSECTAVTVGEVYEYCDSQPGYQNYLMPTYKSVGARFDVNGSVYYASGKDSVEHFMHDKIDVHYDPDDPSTCYAGNSPEKMNPLFLFIVLPVGIACVFILLKK